MKKFFTVVPKQPVGGLKSYVYQAVENLKLQMDKETRFPIISTINGYAIPGEDFRMIAVMQAAGNEERNIEVLKEEFANLCKEKNLLCSRGLEVIKVSPDEKVSTHIETFQTLLDYVDDDDELYLCITYGSKPIQNCVMLAIQYAYRIKKNASISCVVYGCIERDKEPWYGAIYDVTALLQLDEIIHTLAEQGVKNPKKALDVILSL
mgnify:CR=1 FL=1